MGLEIDLRRAGDRVTPAGPLKIGRISGNIFLAMTEGGYILVHISKTRPCSVDPFIVYHSILHTQGTDLVRF